MSDQHFWESGLNFTFSLVSMKLNYGGIISFANKFKFDYINIFKKLLIMEQVLVRPTH